MGKCAIFYFSGTGNTEFVCRCYKKHLEEKGISTDIIPMETLKSAPETGNYQFIGVAYPIYAFTTPAIVRDFLEKLPAGDGEQKAFVITTCAGRFFKGLKRGHNLLRARNYKMTRSENYIMASNFVIEDFGKIPDEESIKDDSGKAMEKSAQVVEDILSGLERAGMEGNIIGTMATLVGDLLFSTMGTKDIGRRLYATDECIACRQCARSCPAGNIVIENDRPVFGSKCIACLRCLNLCPKKAITYKGREKVQRRYRYPGYKPPVVNSEA